MADLGFWHILYFVAVVAVSFLIRGVTGFGGNVVSVPLLALVLPVPVLVPAFAVLGTTAGIGQAIVSWRDIAWDELRRTLPLAAVGVAIGASFFKKLAYMHVFDKALGVFIVVYALYALARLVWPGSRPRSEKRRFLGVIGWVAGFCSGFFSSVFGQGGNFYAIYLHQTDLGKAQLRATLSSFLLSTGVLRIAGYVQTGFFTRAVVITVVMGLPAMIIGMGIGQFVHVKVSRQAISAVIMIILLLSGSALILR